jgi:hypothetical protein
MFCSYCGFSLSSDAAYCSKCGKPIDKKIKEESKNSFTKEQNSEDSTTEEQESEDQKTDTKQPKEDFIEEFGKSFFNPTINRGITKGNIVIYSTYILTIYFLLCSPFRILDNPLMPDFLKRKEGDSVGCYKLSCLSWEEYIYLLLVAFLLAFGRSLNNNKGDDNGNNVS